MVSGFFRRRTPRPRRRGRFVLSLLLIVGGLLWFAPTIAVNSSLKQAFLEQATEDFAGRISTGSISAGWLSPIVVNDLVAQDEQGDPLLVAAAARTQKSLLSLMLDPSQLGVIRIDQPKLHLVLRGNTSNLEDALAPLLNQPSTAAGPINVTLEIVDGTVTAKDETTQRQWEAAGINVTLASQGREALLAGHVEANVTGQDAQGGSVVADFRWQQPQAGGRPASEAGSTSGGAMGSGNLTAEIRRIDLAAVEAVIRRVAPGIRLGGALAGDVAVEWNPEGETISVESLGVDDLQLAAPQWLGSDRVALQRVRLDGQLARQATAWRVKDLVIASDVASLQATGQGTTSASPLEDWSRMAADVWRRGEYQLAGDVDVARIAQMLPNTMRIRDSVQLTSGRIAGSVAAAQSGNGSQWNAQVTATELAGTHDGLPIRFDEPLEVALVARQAGNDLQVDQLTCQASFFRLDASGTPQQGTLAAQGDLTQFFKEVSRFVDVGDLGLAGRMQTDVRWNQVAPGQVALQATAEASDFELTHGDLPPWREAELRVEVAATGTQDAAGTRGLQQATLRVESSGDQLIAELTQPVAPLTAASPLPLRAELQGQLQSWRTRLRPWLPAADISVEGTVDAKVQGVGSPQQVRIDSSDIRIKQLHLVGGGLDIREPEVQLRAQANLHLRDLELVASQATYASASLAFQAEEVRVQSLPQETVVAGRAGFRADLARLTQWAKDPDRPPSDQLAGSAVGQIQLTTAGGLTTAVLQADVADFSYATRSAADARPLERSAGLPSSTPPGPQSTWRSLWSEPLLKVAGTVGYVHQDQTVRLDKIEVAGDALSLGARGKLSDPFGRCYLDVTGQVGYDLARVTQKLRPQLGSFVMLEGRDAKPFKIRGPLMAATETPVSTNSVPRQAASILTELMAHGSLAWTSAEVQGFTIGPGELVTDMADGVATARTLEVPLAEGTLRLMPRLLMNRSPMVLQLAHGSGAENVKITRGMCQSWLKYVAPLVADATAAEGTFTVMLDGASVPLDTPRSADVKGKLTVHQAQIGPGPLARQLLLVGTQVRALVEGQPLTAIAPQSDNWLALPGQEIDFKLLDNRVHHDGLEMNVQDVVIRTRGSVGMDQSLAMVAEIDVRDEWLGSSRYLAGLKGQSIRIPIQGSLSRPRLDQSALQQMTQQTVTGAASQVLQDQLNRGLNRGLEKLFGPQQ